MFEPKDVVPFEPAEFCSVFELAMRAGHGIINSPDPTKYHLDVVGDDGDVMTISPTDLPINRAAFALRQEYGSDPTTFMSVMARLTAVIRFLGEPEAVGWLSPDLEDADSELINVAVVEAAATEPVLADGGFDTASLLVHIQRIADEHERDAG